MNYARLSTLPFALILGYLAYEIVFLENQDMSVYIIPFVVIIAVILILTPQINWYFYNKYPQRLDSKIVSLLSTYNLFYRGLTEKDKIKFEKRLWLSIKQMDFTGMKMENDVPYDLQAIAMSSSIELTFNMEDFIFDNYNRMVFYQHPFPSIIHEDWHTCEHHIEDGVIIFSLEQVMPSFTQQSKYYDICMHEFALILLEDFPLDRWFEENLSWDQLDEMASYNRDEIEAWIGLNQSNNSAAIIHHFHRFKNEFEQQQPDAYKRLSNYLSSIKHKTA